jgi:uncharacterized membrane protein YbhN (UPF0104 family)
MPKKLRPIISLVLLTAALTVGIIYIATHKSLLQQLGRTPPLTSLLVLVLYTVMFGVLVLILDASVRLCRRKLTWHENSLLNSHSLFINFFIPGQGGPAYRGVYLYKRHKLRAKNYIVATLLYYALYAMINVCLLLSGRSTWWEMLAGVAAAAGVSWLVIRRYTRRNGLKADALEVSIRTVGYLLAATALQTALQMVIYGVELHSVNSHIHLSQMVVYTGTANLALFVSLTPGAIGIRESFLIFTEHLNHLSSSNIIVANVIDRSVYLVFLLLLMIVTIALHLRGRWQFKTLPALIRQNFSQFTSSSPTGKQD